MTLANRAQIRVTTNIAALVFVAPLAALALSCSAAGEGSGGDGPGGPGTESAGGAGSTASNSAGTGTDISLGGTNGSRGGGAPCGSTEFTCDPGAGGAFIYPPENVAGSPGTGGALGTGGAPGNGGALGSGGAPGNGGTPGAGGSTTCGPGMICKPGASRYCDDPVGEFTLSTCDPTGHWGPCILVGPPPGWCDPTGFSPELCCPPLGLCCQNDPGGPWEDWGTGACGGILCN